MGKMRRLKRYAAPVHFGISRKAKAWTVSPRAGPHKKTECIPLQVILRDILKKGETIREVKKILAARQIAIDGKIRTDPAYPCGLMDVLEIKRTGEHFRILPRKGRLVVWPITKERAKLKLCQIKDKTTFKGGHIQMNLHDGRNLLIKIKDPKKPAEAKDYRVGDTLVLSLPGQNILERLPLEKGNLAMVTQGKHAGEVGRIKEIIILRGREPNKAVLTTEKEKGAKEVRTLKDYIFVIGTKEAKITLPS